MKQFLLLSLVVVGLLGSCAKKYNSNEEFSLKYGKTAKVTIGGAEYKINFARLKEESRCPPNMECVTSGQAVVEIQIDNNSSYKLGVGGSTPSILEYDSHTIQLLEVSYSKDKYFGKQRYCTAKFITAD